MTTQQEAGQHAKQMALAQLKVNIRSLLTLVDDEQWTTFGYRWRNCEMLLEQLGITEHKEQK